MKSCYIHIPFCESICSYCDFCKMLKFDNLVDKYLIALEKEIGSYYKGEMLDTLYIGGGTPSSLSVSQLEKLFEILSVFKRSNNLEFTIEGNFESTDIEKLKLYKKYGVNRLSFGLETINSEGLNLLERVYDAKQVGLIINSAKDLGFDNINIDLIYAYPNQTMRMLEKDLEYILSLEVSHISTYSLIIEDNTKLSINKVNYIEEDLDYAMYKKICDTLRKNDYNHYEISNFSKDGYYSKHNLCYWNNDHYYGFGLGASSYIDNERISNTRSINKYIDGNFRLEVIDIDYDKNIEYQIMLNLRKKSGINLDKFNEKFHVNLFDIYNCGELINSKLLIYDGLNLFIPEKKWYISNEIIIRLLGSEISE